MNSKVLRGAKRVIIIQFPFHFRNINRANNKYNWLTLLLCYSDGFKYLLSTNGRKCSNVVSEINAIRIQLGEPKLKTQ